MSRQVVDTVRLKPRTSYEVESFETGEWETLSYSSDLKTPATFKSRGHAKRIAKAYGQLHSTDTRVVKVD